MFSDDPRGESWEVGMLMMKNDQFSNVGYDPQPSESTVVELSNGCMPDVLQGSVRPISRGGQTVSRVTRSGIGRREAKQSKKITLPHPVAESPPLDHGQAEHRASGSSRDLDRALHFSSQRASVASIDKQALHMERPVSRR